MAMAVIAAWLAITTLVALAALVAFPGRQPVSSVRYGDVLLLGWPGGVRLAILFGLSAVSLFVAGTSAWLAMGDQRLAALTYALAATWIAPELVGWESGPPVVRGVTYLVAPLFLPLSVLVPIRALGVRPGRAARRALVILTTTVASLAVVRAVSYDPFMDIACVSHCDYGIFALVRAVPVARTATSLLAVVAIGVGLANATWTVVRMLRLRPIDRPRQGWILGATLALGVSTATWAVVRIVVPHEDPAAAGFLVPGVLTAICLAALGIAACERMAQITRRRVAVLRIADRLDVEEIDGGGTTAILARTLGDAQVAIAFPLLDGSGFVDEGGDPVPEPVPTSGRAVTAVERDGARVALITHDADIGSQLLSREIGATARLTLENARLTALVRARLRQLRASRARIVETGDRARQSLERDLHDGAQQCSLAVSFELRLACETAFMSAGSPEERSRLDEAIAEVDDALTELRELARGIHPVVLTEEGLRSALVSLADRTRVTLVVHGDDRLGLDEAVLIAAYQVATEAVAEAEASGCHRVDILLSLDDAWLRMAVTADRLGAGPSQEVEDRVGAAGGSVRHETRDGWATLIEVRLPCG